MISLLIYTRNTGAALPCPAWRRPAAQPIGFFLYMSLMLYFCKEYSNFLAIFKRTNLLHRLIQLDYSKE